MTGFNASFYGTRIFIDGGKEYKLGEILAKYLSKNFKGLEEMYDISKRYVSTLRYPEDDEQASYCNEFFQSAMNFYCYVEDLICSLPPYNALNLRKNRLYELLNEHKWMFDNEPDLHEWDDYDRLHPEYNDNFYTNLPLDSIKEADYIDKVLQFNEKLKAFAEEYFLFVEDLMRVKKVYEPFLEKLHSQSRYLENSETADIVAEFMDSVKPSMKYYDKLQASGNIQISYKVLKQKKSSVLCESYHFDTIGAFLYIELFKGLELHFLPKKCGYCNRYFLLEAGIYSDYCTRPVKGMEDKICRDVGHRKKYADKVKNDPVWQTYVRAYKQHYARYLKKKMTQAEFQRWADYALDLRDKAENGELEFEVYRDEIRR